jgi:hypothetical protein
VAVVAWEREGKRGYQFEDGQLRVFTSGYYDRLDPVAVSPDRIRTLLALLGLPLPVTPTIPPGAMDPPTIDQQIAYFLRAYPGGFTAEKWRSERRGNPSRSLKRHRDPAVALARAEITAAGLLASLQQGSEPQAVQTLATVLGRTDLVPSAHLQRLSSLPPMRSRAIILGLSELLFSRTSVEVRVVQWVHALNRGTGRAPTWSLVTAPLALLQPDQHVCVDRASFLMQAASIAPRLRVPASPTGAEYAPLLAMAESVRERLKNESSPGDLLDVRDFIAFTMSSGACKAIAATA